jgi:predicted ATPase/DNA-binding SARP family transcriptional activator
MASHTRIELFNGLRVVRGDDIVTTFETQHTKGVLAYLAYHMPNWQHKETICDEFWPDANSPKARNSLSQAVSSLRRIVEPYGMERGAVIEATQSEVRLNPDAVTTDVGEFRRKLELARRADGDDLVRRHHLEDAVALYAGPFLRGSVFDWAISAERHLAEVFFGAARDLGALLDRVGEQGRAVEVAERALREDNTREEIHRDLMGLFLRAGQASQANARYRELVRILKEEDLGEPDEETRALARQIQTALRSIPAEQSTPAAPRAGGPSRRAPSRPASGTVTFLMTALDPDGETPAEAPRDRLHRLLASVASRHGGRASAPVGPAAVLAFAGAGDALAAALALRRDLEESPRHAALRGARMAVDTGDVRFVEGRYEGATVDRAGRLLAAANPGQIICSQPCAEIARGDGDSPFRFTSLGPFVLSGAQQARVVQADDSAGPARTFPPLRAAPAYGARITQYSTRFFGRNAEIADLRARLLDRRQRLVTVTGPGGNGKTRLVKEAASELIGDYRGAVWFVALDNVGDQDMMIDAIRDELRLPPNPHAAPIDQVVSALSEQPSLLVLDNFEQLVQGDAPLVVSRLLERVPDLQCLITSRLVLNLVGEHEIALSPLPTPNGASAPETLAVVESVQLFIDRARLRDPDFQVTNTNAAAVAGICDHLDGIPLAIELAAALSLPPREILARMQNRFEFLTSRSRDRHGRHRTMLACIDIGYDLLAPELQRFFTRLCAFRGSWSDSAAEEILGEPLALDFLTELREASFLISENTDDEIRFRMLETLREYALLKISPTDKENVVQRHAGYYLDLAETAIPEYDRIDQAAWYARMSRDHDNLRAATRWAIEGAQHDLHARLVLARFPIMYRDGYWDEAQRGLDAALVAVSAASGDRHELDSLLAALHYRTAYLAEDRGEFEFAREALGQSLAIRRSLDDRLGTTDTLILSGVIATHLSRYNEARNLFNEAAVYAAGDPLRLAKVNQGLATVAGHLKDEAVNRTLTEAALELFKIAGDSRSHSIAMFNLGKILLSAGEHEAASAYFRQSIAQLRHIGDTAALPMAVNNLGCLALKEGNYAVAVTLCHHSARMAERVRSHAVHYARRSLNELADLVGPDRYAVLISEAETASWEAAAGLEQSS